MNGVRFPSALTGVAALALLVGSTASAQQVTGQQAQNAQGVAAGSRTVLITAEEAQTRGAATQILQQIEATRLALRQGGSEDARDLLDQINTMAQQAAASGNEAQMLPIQAQVQQAITALLDGDLEGTLAALDDATRSMQEVEQDAAAKGAAGIAGQRQADVPSPAPRQPTQGRVVVQSSVAEGASDQPEQPQKPEGEAAAQVSGSTVAPPAAGVNQQALLEAQGALEMARRDVEAALRSVGEAEAALARAAGDGRSGRVAVMELQPSEGQHAVRSGLAVPSERASPLSQEETLQLLGMGDRQPGEPSEMLAMTAGDLRARKVVTFDGRSLGEIDRIVSNGGAIYAVIEHGGFLGIGGSKVAVPAHRLGMRGDEIVLLGLSEEQLDRMPSDDLGGGQELGREQLIEIGRYD